jgi:hypothetical protein
MPVLTAEDWNKTGVSRFDRSKDLFRTTTIGATSLGEAVMAQTWNAVATRWHRLMLVMVVSVGVCVSACTAPSPSSSHPATIPSEGGSTGPKDSGNGAKGY